MNNQTVKGTSDWLPAQFKIKKYIFDTWREVCVNFGYDEYLCPIVEFAELYRAKSGEDVGGSELTVFTDRGGRELAIRPEMTPSVTRMVSTIYQSTPKPIRLFSIANFYRNEQPQRGRQREFWQLNFDIFGTDSLNADVEIISLGIEIMKKFGADENMFTCYINNRKLINFILNRFTDNSENAKLLIRIIDKIHKLSTTELDTKLSELGLSSSNILELKNIFSCTSLKDIEDLIPEIQNEIGFTELKNIELRLKELNYEKFVKIDFSLMRGFDYYDGTIFEFFDNHVDNKRAMFGGGRYNGLARIFDMPDIPAVGCAPGDVTTQLFLESWKLLPKNLAVDKTYFPIVSSDISQRNRILKLRVNEPIVEGLEFETISNSLKTANKNGYTKIILFGDNEILKGEYVIKDLKTGEQTTFTL